MIFVNFKSYKEASGDNAVRLAIACETVFEQTRVQIIPIVQTIDLWRIKQHVNIPVWLQHVDEKEAGAFTGHTTAEAAMLSDADGTLLNHSEKPASIEQMEKTITHIKSLDSSFGVMICAPDINVLTAVEKLAPTYISYEPPELIGSKTESVATAKADVISAGVEIAKEIPLIVGAGIKSKEDVVAALRKNAKGILVASAVVTAEHPDEKLHALASAFKSF